MVLHTPAHVIGYSRRDHDTNEYTFMEDDQFVAFLFLLYQTWSIARIGPHVYWSKYLYVQTSLCFFLVISPENYEVASFLITGLKLLFNDADNFRHSNDVPVMITLIFRATLWNLRFKNLFCEQHSKISCVTLSTYGPPKFFSKTFKFSMIF